MSVSLSADRILLSGAASVEDAERLLAALLEQPDHAIDLSGLKSAHLAVVQLLHAAGRPLLGLDDNAFLRGIALRSLAALAI